MRESDSILVPASMAGPARTCTQSSTNLHTIIGKVASIHRRGAAKWLERVTKRSPRTVKYWLAGTYEPRGEDALKIARALKRELDAMRADVEQFELSF